MKRSIQVVGWLFFAVLLSSCVQIETPTTTLPFTPILTTSIPAASPIPPTITPTAYPPILTNTSTPTTSYAPVATKTNEQVYIDPQGWYSVNIPNEWQAADSPNSFIGENGFFATGYLPEMMFMRHSMDVCQWLANIDTKDTYSIGLMSIQNGCRLTSLSGVTPPAVLSIIGNPTADYSQRFLYIETDTEHFSDIISTFAWLQPVNPYGEPAFHMATLRPEDVSFWKKTDPLPLGFSIDEYELPEKAQGESPSEKIFLNYIPIDAPREKRKQGTAWLPETWEDINEKISPFGYELRPTSQVHLYQLYKYDVLVLDKIYRLPSVHHFLTSKGDRVVFFVRTFKDPDQSSYALDNAVSYLVQNNSITKWEDGPGNPMDPELPPILIEDELLWLQVGEYIHLQVLNNQRDILFSFATYFGARLPVNRFKAWNDHWILEVSDFLIQDGEIINAKFGFEEVFDWRSINGKPFYFFRKGPRIGISYDGQFLPVYYHEVAHGYCCGLALNNPRMNENTLRFFGKRDGLWYYIIVEIN